MKASIPEGYQSERGSRQYPRYIVAMTLATESLAPVVSTTEVVAAAIFDLRPFAKPG